MTLNQPVDLSHVCACERCGTPLVGLFAVELPLCGFCVNDIHEIEEARQDAINELNLHYQRDLEVPVPPKDGHSTHVPRAGKAPDSADVQPNHPFGKRLRNNRNRRS